MSSATSLFCTRYEIIGDFSAAVHVLQHITCRHADLPTPGASLASLVAIVATCWATGSAGLLQESRNGFPGGKATFECVVLSLEKLHGASMLHQFVVMLAMCIKPARLMDGVAGR